MSAHDHLRAALDALIRERDNAPTDRDADMLDAIYDVVDVMSRLTAPNVGWFYRLEKCDPLENQVGRLLNIVDGPNEAEVRR